MSVRNVVKSIQDIMRQDVGVDGDPQRISQLCWMFFLKIIDDQDQELMQEGYRLPIPAKLRWRAWAADPEGITGAAARLRQRRVVPGAEGAARHREERSAPHGARRVRPSPSDFASGLPALIQLRICTSRIVPIAVLLPGGE